QPAMGVLAALRLVPLLADQWRTVTLARRARGLEAGRNPLAALSIFFGKLFALLVRAVRTGTLLATAMDARAFGTGPRSHARVSRWRTADTLLVVAGPLLLGAAYAVSAHLGTLRLLFRCAGRGRPPGSPDRGRPLPAILSTGPDAAKRPHPPVTVSGDRPGQPLAFPRRGGALP